MLKCLLTIRICIVMNSVADSKAWEVAQIPHALPGLGQSTTLLKEYNFEEICQQLMKLEDIFAWL